MDVNQASIKRNGIQDFISLRGTGIIIAAYAIYMIGFILTTPEMTYDIWKTAFSGLGMKIFTILTLGCISVHARIGMWQVATDYIKNPKLRGVLAFFVNILCFSYVAAGLFVLWGA